MLDASVVTVVVDADTADARRSSRKVGGWVTKGGLAILDQGLISGSNFLIGILLARWLVPAQYGAFSLAFSVFLLLSYVYQSVLSEPQAVFSGSAYRQCLRGYLKALLGIQLVVTLFGIVSARRIRSGCVRDGKSRRVARRAGGSGHRFSVHSVFLAAAPLFLHEPGAGARGHGSFHLFRPGKRRLVRRLQEGPDVALLRVSADGDRSSGHRPFPADAGEEGSASRHCRRAHCSASMAQTLGVRTWALAVSVVTWIPYYMYYPLVSAFSGMAAAGQLKALMNLSLPLEQTYTALSILFLPYAARVCREKGISSSGPLVRRITMLFVGGAVAYWGLLIPFKVSVFHILYGGKYMEVAPFIPYVAIGTTMWSAAFGPAILLRAIESPDSIFCARIVASVFSLLIGVPATRSFGLWGVVGQHHRGQYCRLLYFDVYPPAQVECSYGTESGSKGKANR